MLTYFAHGKKWPCTLIWTCTFIYFLKSVDPVRIYGPARLFETQEYVTVCWTKLTFLKVWTLWMIILKILQEGLVNFDIRKNVEHFLGWLSSNLSIQKSPTAEIISIYFIGTIVPIEIMLIISLLGSFVSINNQTRKCSTFSDVKVK